MSVSQSKMSTLKDKIEAPIVPEAPAVEVEAEDKVVITRKKKK